MMVVFDTNILIDHLLGHPEAAIEMKRWPEPAISIITWMEVLAGAKTPDEVAMCHQLLAEFMVLPLSAQIAEQAVALRRESRIRLPDAVIGASARVHQAILVTRNTKDFSPGSFVRVPYQIHPR